jgi:methionyl-tRNA formyltransferase
MKIVFFGSSPFSIPFLKSILSSGNQIAAVVTQPDRPKGRGLKLSQTPVKEFSLKNGLSVFQPESINTQEAVGFLKKLNPDLFVVVAYGEILPKSVLDIPKIFSINVHASLLPKYRGAAPINWAIINGETSTGITIIKMDAGLDTGAIILQESINIDENDDAFILEEKLAKLAEPLLPESLERIKNKNFSLIPQDESKISLAPKLKKENGLIDWSKSAEQIKNLIRGCIIWPTAFTHYQGKRLKIFKAKAIPYITKGREPGEIININKEGITVVTQAGSLLIEELQLEGKRKMRVEEFISGHKIYIGEKFGKK